jgi:nucleoside phosphorylase
MESFAIAQTAATYCIPMAIIKAVSDVVPEHISLAGLLTLAGSFRAKAQKARDRLNATLKRLFEDQDLFKYISET